MTELVAMLTPAVAMGLQWVTALCDGPPLLSIIDLCYLLYSCLVTGGHCEENSLSHCILKH
jgi:hypothetical protein